MKPEIYIDGQPYDGTIGELKVEPADIPEVPKVVRVASPVEAILHVSIQPDVLAQIITKSTKEAIKAFRELVAAVESLNGRAINPRCYHLSRYARKVRIRKKNRARLTRERLACYGYVTQKYWEVPKSDWGPGA